MPKTSNKKSLTRRLHYFIYYKLIEPIPSPIKHCLRMIYYFPADLFDRLTGQKHLMPPRALITGSKPKDFKKIGEEFKKHFIELGNLKPEGRVLDVGCGIGRMAIPLTHYLSSSGSYEGFDIDKKGIEWCQKNVTPKFNNFQFQYSDIYNQFYNKTGKHLAHDYRFPYEDDSFDLVFLYSVFTHLLPKDLKHYLSEIARVLKPNGRCLITWFLLNEETKPLIQSGKSAFDFKFKEEGYTTIDPNVPEGATAYDESDMRTFYQQVNLKILEPIHFGWWCGRKHFKSFQDIVVAEKN